MARTVKQLTEHDVHGTRLRVVSDLASGIAGIVAAEERVIRGLAAAGYWPHRGVTLFVLDTLDSLVGELHAVRKVGEYSDSDIPLRPMVNVYDLANPAECFIFVNRQVMAAEGYWGDELAGEGLLAHEHAHPLAECQASGVARTLEACGERLEGVSSQPWAATLERLAIALSAGAVSEILANEFCLRAGFGDALFHLDRIVVRRMQHNLGQRSHLEQRLANAVASGNLGRDDAGILLLLADAQAHLPFALEVAPFFRSGQALRGNELEDEFVKAVLLRVEPEVAEFYTTLRNHYAYLRPEWDATRLRPWCSNVCSLLLTVVAKRQERVS